MPDRATHAPDRPLAGADAAAFDALMEAGFDPGAVEPALRPRAERLAGLLGLLDSPSTELAGHGELTEGALARIRGDLESRVRLSPRDDEALESWVMHGGESARTPSSLRARCEFHSALRDAVTTLSAEGEAWIGSGRGARIEAVLGATRSPEGAPIPFESGFARRGWRFMDLVAAAAVLLIATGLGLPVLHAMNEGGRRTACLSNLHWTGLGLGMYALSNNDAMPMSTAGFGGAWSQVGSPGRSHSANLFTLVRTKHVPSWSLDCPGNEAAPRSAPGQDAEDWGSLEEVSYSYRLMPRGQASLRSLASDAVILADRSPILIAGMRGQRVSPEASSPNHGLMGQHLLRVDGSVVWTDSPVLADGDNIWLPRIVEEFVHNVRKKYGYVDGFELPANTTDTFLGP
jgi:hypothetical protein